MGWGRHTFERLFSSSQKSAGILQELLEKGYVLDYIDQHSSPSVERARHSGRGSRSGSSRTSQMVVTWTSLFHSVLCFIAKEVDSIQKLEEKGSAGSANSQSIRLTKKSVCLIVLQRMFNCNYLLKLQDVSEMLRAYISASNKSKESLIFIIRW